MSEPADHSASEGQGSAWRADLLHLFPLWGFAVAQPLFNVLSASPEFFVAHRYTASGLIGFALIISIGVPMVLAGLEVLIRRLNETMRLWCHRLIVALLAAATALGAINLFLDSTLAVNGSLAIVTGLTATTLYVVKHGVRRFFSILAPAALLFPLSFLVFSPVSKLVFATAETVNTARVQSQTPIVLVVFDEFNPTALLDADRRIDPVRYPNFAALADTAHWFPNANGIHKRTLAAMPAILGGRVPGTELPPPTASVYPRTLFTWLGGTYRLNVWESLTSLCPADLCDTAETVGGFDLSVFVSDVSLVYAYILVPPRLRAEWLPPLDTSWKGFGDRTEPTPEPANPSAENEARSAQEVLEENFAGASAGRAEVFQSFLANIQRGSATLDFLHTLLPHGPYEYLSDGSEYTAAVEGRPLGVWSENEHLVAVAYQRYLHQLGFVDTLVGQLVARLKAVGKFDEALIILTADHGISFEPGIHQREPAGPNAAAIYNVPMFIKLPGQTKGMVSERPVSNADILATIADVLGEAPPWDIDGSSALTEGQTGILQPRDGTREFDLAAFSIAEQLDWHVENFGTGITLADTVIRTEFAGLIGRDISDFEWMADPGQVSMSSETVRYLASVDRDGGLVPVIFNGELTGSGQGPHWVALALNGKIAAVAPTFEKGTASTHIHAMFQPDAILDGRNGLQAFLIQGTEESPLLLPIRMPDLESYRLTRGDGWELIQSNSGESYQIKAGVARGYLDLLTEHRGTVQARGWAVDSGTSTLPKAVLAQVNGGDLHLAELRVSRPDVANALDNNSYTLSGFRVLAPGVSELSQIQSLRLFILSNDGYAGEVMVDPTELEVLTRN